MKITNQEKHDNTKIEPGIVHNVNTLIEYEQDELVSTTIIKKNTGSINVLSFPAGERFAQKISPFDTYVFIIDGSATVEIAGKTSTLQAGDGILISAHTRSHIQSTDRCKVILTVIKSGYEDV